MNVDMLSSARYQPGLTASDFPRSPLARSHDLNTIVEDDSAVPRYYFAPRYSTISQADSTLSPQAAMLSPVYSEDFPTPRANQSYHSNMQSPAESEFDDLYDISDDESEREVPLICSNSVKKTTVRTNRSRYPSLVIPSPSAWPTIEKLKNAMSPVAPTPTQLLSPSANILNMLAARSLQVPASSATPSLDGSMTSEEMEHLSCPSTPDMAMAGRNDVSDEDVNAWLPPVQLHPQAFETLQHLRHLTRDEHEEHHEVTQLIEIPEGEMTEVMRPQLSLSVDGLNSPVQFADWGSEPVSALSIPSPGGFFSSLEATTRHTWSIPNPESLMPTTTTAERFYNVPWDARDSIIEQSVTLVGSTVAGTDGPPTAKPAALHGEEEVEIKEIDPSKTVFQYNEKYHDELEKMAGANKDRTSDWLAEQDELQSMLRDMNLPAKTTTPTHSRGNSLDKSPKKSVRFQEEQSEESIDEDDDKPKKTVTYVQGFEHLQNRGQKGDAFIHRQTRAEAMHIQRRCMPKVHRDQLLGKFELTNPVRPSPPRPVSSFYTEDPTVLKERIARAQMERQALDQMSPSTWVLQAQKTLNGGKLLSAPAWKSLSQIRSPRILDVGGQPTCDWAWQLAFDHPRSTVTTVFPPGHNLTASTVQGPTNHKQMPVPNLWTLPFPSGAFDVISARSLYALLKTDKPVGRALDEYDLCLKECFRCLKPGGYLEFSLIDSDIIRAGRQAQAMGVEFGFNLKTRGYDPQPTKTFLPRLRKAGFDEVQRAWMILPMGKPAANWRDTLPVGADARNSPEKSIGPDGDVDVAVPEVLGSTSNAANLTGTVGAWAWEKWMLKLQVEMGKEEEKLLEGVVQVLEEGAKDGAGWRSLTGWARKPAAAQK
ncbi:uncharacterized protein BDZ99DRAFT_83118 [Mytilinidion resinicola]|uniref:Methyltransferase type 11 domain-containing protein n=1 Tax=Mytilinidion resinicola TaxID=574789 RepID=A0A6A6YCY5_9PEZI|nr:uncharacterized protein BDZ99DRAFT_83118 [Mytilinidion resinicola]KAF2806682.1 hypothetical protein BDZ99DRAFT_83118 [Mytilinidion resinicola]